MITYKTRQREAIMQLFTEHPDVCYTAREIIERGEVDAGQATVYRTLAALTAENKLRRFSSGTGADCYRLACKTPTDGHVHAVCLVCGDIIHADGHFLDEASYSLLERYGFRIDPSRTVIYGTCRECSRALGGTENEE